MGSNTRSDKIELSYRFYLGELIELYFKLYFDQCRQNRLFLWPCTGVTFGSHHFFDGRQKPAYASYNYFLRLTLTATQIRHGMPVIIIDNIAPTRALSCCSEVGAISSEPFISHSSESIKRSKRTAISISKKKCMIFSFGITLPF